LLYFSHDFSCCILHCSFVHPLRNSAFKVLFCFFVCWTYTSTMMMEVTGSFETSVCCYQTVWWHVPEVTAMRTGSLPWFLTYVMKFDCGTKYVPVE
jgi:hypothetical protein